MKNLALIFLLLLASCTQPLQKMWTETGKFSIVPIAPGRLLWSSQDTYALTGSSGGTLWTKTLQGVKRTAVYNLANNLFVTGDERIILKINGMGDTLWKIELSENQSAFPVAVTDRLLITAFDSNTGYPQNPVSLIAFSLEDGSHTWQLDDHDYAGVLTVPVKPYPVTHLVIPQIVGDSVFLEGFDTIDGKFLWRKTWDRPPSGMHTIIDSMKAFCWIWKKTPSGIELGTIEKMTGAIRTVKHDDVAGLSDRIAIGSMLYLKLRSGSISVSSDLKVSRLDGIWFPVCEIPATDKIAVIDRQCTTIAVSDQGLKTAKKAFNVSVCYKGIPGNGYGEVYLYPVVSPVDYPTFRCQLVTDGIESLRQAPNILRNLGKGSRLTDIYELVRKFRR